MEEIFQRTELLLGKEAITKLHGSRVAVFGIGGVGGYAVEALARSGVGAIDLIDNDVICPSNINRQIIATRKTVGRYKVERAHAASRQRLDGIAAHAAYAEHRHARSAQLVHGVFTEYELCPRILF